MRPRTFVAVPESAPARRAPLNRRHGPVLALSVILLLGPTVAAAQTDQAGEPPPRCTTYATGTDTHTDCQSAGSAASSPAIHCTNSITGNDTHTATATPSALPPIPTAASQYAPPVPLGPRRARHRVSRRRVAVPSAPLDRARHRSH